MVQLRHLQVEVEEQNPMQNEAYPFDLKHSKWDCGGERSVVVCVSEKGGKGKREKKKGRENARGGCGPG